MISLKHLHNNNRCVIKVNENSSVYVINMSNLGISQEDED